MKKGAGAGAAGAAAPAKGAGLSATRVDVYEAVAARAELDKEAAKAASAALGAPVSTRLQDLRLLLTGLGTALACLAQFYPPGKYPANWVGLAIACPLYVVVNGLVTYWLPAQEQDIAAEVGGVVLRSRLDTERHVYGLSAGGAWAEERLGRLFTEEGHVRLAVLAALVQQALAKGGKLK